MPVRLQITSSLGALLSRKVLLLSAIGCLSAALANAQAPIIDAGQSSSSARTKSASGGATGNSSVTGDLLLQLQSLQQEVMELRGTIEEQSHQIQTLKQQSLDRYNDLDQRISHTQGGASSAPTQAAPIDANATPAAPDAVAAVAPASSAGAVAVPIAVPIAVPGASMETAKPEEYEAYQVAYSKLKGQDFNSAIKAFNIFLVTYPNSPLVPNSHYWLGKAYLLVQPQDLNKAQTAFAKVSEYPQSNKVPDALYELGKVYFLKGDKAKAKTTLQQVIDNYGASGSSAPQLAKQFLDQNFPAAKH